MRQKKFTTKARRYNAGTLHLRNSILVGPFFSLSNLSQDLAANCAGNAVIDDTPGHNITWAEKFGTVPTGYFDFGPTLGCPTTFLKGNPKPAGHINPLEAPVTIELIRSWGNSVQRLDQCRQISRSLLLCG